MIHKANCAPHYACKYFAQTRPGGRKVSPSCARLDELLDFNDEMLLHDKARSMYASWEQMPTGRNAHGPGVIWSVREVDPFEEVEDGGVVDILSPKSVDGYPGCPSCEKGSKHYHRKSDGSRVISPDKEEI